MVSGFFFFATSFELAADVGGLFWGRFFFFFFLHPRCQAAQRCLHFSHHPPNEVFSGGFENSRRSNTLRPMHDEAFVLCNFSFCYAQREA